MAAGDADEILRRFSTDDPARVVGPGHPIGDFLDAPGWRVLERGHGRLRVRASLPDRVMNPRGELFGGFTPTYADFFALHLYHTAREPEKPRHWLATADLRVDYFLPICGPEVEISGEILHRSGRTGHVLVRFSDDAGGLCAVSQLTLIERRG